MSIITNIQILFKTWHFPDNSNTLNIYTDDQSFEVGLKIPSPNTLQIQWELNGIQLSEETSLITLNGDRLQNGENILKVKVTDSSSLSRSYLPADGYVFEEIWNIVYYAPCSPVINLANSPIQSQLYHAQTTINASTNIMANGDVQFKAGQEIILQPDFEVSLGAVLVVEIEECTN